MKFTIFSRLVFGYLFILVLVLGLSGYLVYRIGQFNEVTRSVLMTNNRVVDYSGKMTDAILSQIRNERKFIISKDKAFYKQYLSPTCGPPSAPRRPAASSPDRGATPPAEDVIWVDHGAAVSMHRVRATVPAERRLERLATPSVEDNRISYGCINVPAAFYDASVRPAFAQGPGIVHVLPEHRSVRREFRADDDAQATSRRPPAYARLTPAPITPQDTR